MEPAATHKKSTSTGPATPRGSNLGSLNQVNSDAFATRHMNLDKLPRHPAAEEARESAPKAEKSAKGKKRRGETVPAGAQQVSPLKDKRKRKDKQVARESPAKHQKPDTITLREEDQMEVDEDFLAAVKTALPYSGQADEEDLYDEFTDAEENGTVDTGNTRVQQDGGDVNTMDIDNEDTTPAVSAEGGVPTTDTPSKRAAKRARQKLNKKKGQAEKGLEKLTVSETQNSPKSKKSSKSSKVAKASPKKQASKQAKEKLAAKLTKALEAKVAKKTEAKTDDKTAKWAPKDVTALERDFANMHALLISRQHPGDPNPNGELIAADIWKSVGNVKQVFEWGDIWGVEFQLNQDLNALVGTKVPVNVPTGSGKEPAKVTMVLRKGVDLSQTIFYLSESSTRPFQAVIQAIESSWGTNNFSVYQRYIGSIALDQWTVVFNSPPSKKVSKIFLEGTDNGKGNWSMSVVAAGSQCKFCKALDCKPGLCRQQRIVYPLNNPPNA